MDKIDLWISGQSENGLLKRGSSWNAIQQEVDTLEQQERVRLSEDRNDRAQQLSTRFAISNLDSFISDSAELSNSRQIGWLS